MNCVHCESVYTVKKWTFKKLQKYFCKSCESYFKANSIPRKQKIYIVKCFLNNNISIRKYSKNYWYHRKTISTWIKKYNLWVL